TESFGKPFSEKKSMKMIMEEMKKFISGNKIWGYAITHANNLSTANWFAGQIEELTGKKPEYIQNASPVLVTNVGVGVVSVTIMLD
ncbi:MAG TPA: hypothetical protein ENH02_08605, partial [Bacteroidetes bacterium]|nr:hypothetical protein [Bacteroidota bacterium]